MMTLSLELILQELSDSFLPLVFMGGENVRFSGVALFSGSTPPENLSLLYVGRLSDLLALTAEQTDGFVFCLFGDIDEFKTVQQIHRCTILYYVQGLDLAACYNRLSALFARYQKWDAELEGILQNNGSLQDIFDASEPFFENPLYAWDGTYRVQAMTYNIPADHPLLQIYVQTNQVPQQILSQLTSIRDSLFYETSHYKSVQLYYPPNVSNLAYALRTIRSGQQTGLVFVCYFLNTPPSIVQQELLEMLSEKLERYVSERVPRSSHQAMLYEPFVIDLIEGNLHHEHDIRERLKLIRLPYEMKYRIYYIVSPVSNTPVINYLRHSCKQYLPYAKAILYKDAVLLLNQEGRDQRSREELEPMFVKGREALQRIGAVCGISSAFSNLSQTRNAYHQAVAACNLGQTLSPGRTSYLYRDYYLYHVLAVCSKSPEINLGQLYFNRLDELEEQDRLTSNDNMRLLETYLRNNRNITNTAREMFLHRNSVIYRLDRIFELLQVPAQNPDIQFRLLISFQIRRLHRLQRENIIDPRF